VSFGALIKAVDLKPKSQIMYPFTEAYLNSKNDDINARWYISFQCWDVQKNQKIRKWDYSVNDFKTVRERKSYAKKRIEAINHLLSQGFHVDSDKIEKSEFITVRDGINSALKSISVSHATLLSYNSVIRLFLGWAEKNNHDNFLINQYPVQCAFVP